MKIRVKFFKKNKNLQGSSRALLRRVLKRAFIFLPESARIFKDFLVRVFENLSLSCQDLHRKIHAFSTCRNMHIINEETFNLVILWRAFLLN